MRRSEEALYYCSLCPPTERAPGSDWFSSSKADPGSAAAAAYHVGVTIICQLGDLFMGGFTSDGTVDGDGSRLR